MPESQHDVQPDRELAARAHSLGVATSYLDWAGEEVVVDAEVITAMVARLGLTAPRAEAPVAARLPQAPRCWGWSVQLYALHSPSSWGIGDLADLRQLAVRSATELGAGLVLVNPLHAVAPVYPLQDSPYFPTSRRYVSPLYLRIDEVPAYAAAPAEVRAQVDALRLPPAEDRIDRDEVWRAKSAALQLLQPYAIMTAPDGDLADFATFCALAEEFGLPWQDWPAELRRPDAAGIASARERLAHRIVFHAWLQTLCDQQLATVQQAALDAGMAVGIVHDLAVGVDPGGADAWALQDVLAGDVTVGAPPDSFNQRGQDWSLPPWRPDALAAADYAPFRTMIDAVLSRGGGVRVDHVMGLFRLWWVLRGEPASRGTYVSYDDAAMLGALTDVALRHGGLVVGEDLGTVEPRVREELAARGVLGSAVLWFERLDDDPSGAPKPPGQWRELAMASISTHDLPTAPGFLVGEHVRLRDELGQLGRPVAEEQEQADREKQALLDLLVEESLLNPSDVGDTDAVVLAMHALLARTPSRIVLASPYDLVGEVRQPNLPGTRHEYPNWRIPLPVTLEQLLADPRVGRVAQALHDR